MTINKKSQHTQWANVSGPTELPNVSGASVQDAALVIGDTCYSESDSTLYFCTTATVGSAVWSATGGGSGTDDDAIHDNVANEISALTSKTAVALNDIFIIEDSENSHNKKKVYATNIEDYTAIHDDVAGEIAAVTEKPTPVTADLIIIEDSADSNNKKSAQLGNLPSSGTDADAIHDNVAAEISAVTEKTTPVGTDLLLIEDSFDSNNKKKVQITNLPSSGTDSDAIHDNVSGEIAAITAKATPTTSDYLIIEDAAVANAKKSITIGDLPGSTDSDAIHDNVTGEINAIADKASPVGADILIIEDSAASYAKKKVSITNLPGGADADAIHDNVAAEISAVTEKATPVSADLLLIEDSADTNNKKRVQIGNLPTGADADAIHDNVTGEINAIADKASPVGADILIIEDSAASYAKKKVSITNLPGGSDADAIHDNVAAEISAVTEKATPVSADLLLIEDSADSNNKKRVQVGNLPTGSDSDAIHDNVSGEIAAITAKATPTTADYLVIEDAAATNAKKSITIGDIPSLGADSDAIHDNVAAEISAVATKALPVSGDYLLIEDSADSNNKKKVTIGTLPTGSGDSAAIHDNVAAEISAITEKATPVSADLLIIEDSADSNNKKKVQVGNLPSGGGGGGGDTVAALNEAITMGASAVEIDIGAFTYDGSSGASHTFKAVVEPDSAVTCEIRLYDRGPVAGPAVAAQLASKLTTSTVGLQVLSLTLTASASPTFPDNDEIYNTDRMYAVRAYISGTLGDVLYVGKVSLEGA